MSHKSPQQRVVMGLILAFIGLVFLLDNFRIFDARSVLSFWPVVFIVVGALKLVHARNPGAYIVGGGVLVAGVLLMLSHMGLLDIRWRDWWPVLMIAGGLVVIFQGHLRRGDGSDGMLHESTQDPAVDLTVIMGGTQLKVDSQDFRGGDVTSVMAGVELDLRGASIATEATLQVFVVMGGVDIRIPADWTVIVNGIPLMAGIEDKSVPPAQPGKRLVITGYLLMGGMEIKN